MEAFVHMTGYVGGDVEIRRGNVAVASFRLASTPRIRRGGEWVDGQTTWLTVTCFRTLAEHVAASVTKGDPVVVVGKLRTSVFDRDGSVVERLALEASTVGHDLLRGTAQFQRMERVAGSDDRESDLAEVLDSVESQHRDQLSGEPVTVSTSKAAAQGAGRAA